MLADSEVLRCSASIVLHMEVYLETLFQVPIRLKCNHFSATLNLSSTNIIISPNFNLQANHVPISLSPTWCHLANVSMLTH